MDPKSELARERSVLVKADVDLQRGAQRIDLQAALVSDLRARDLDVREAERLLVLLRETLEQWRQHRLLILQRIVHLEAKLQAGGRGEQPYP